MKKEPEEMQIDRPVLNAWYAPAYTLEKRKSMLRLDLEYEKSVNQISLAKKIIKTILINYGVSLDEVRGPSRKRYLVDVRKVISWLLTRNTLLSLELIGGMIDRDHASILHYVRETKNLLQTDLVFRHEMEKIGNKLNLEY